MRKKRPPKSGDEIWFGGDFFNPRDPQSVPQEIARKGFLVLASELFGVTADLRDTVLPLYVVASNAPDSDMEPFTTAMMQWASKYRLRFRWVLDQALDTLLLWKLFPAISKLDQLNPPWHPIFHLVKRRSRPEAAVPFVFTYQSPAFEITAEATRNWLEAGGWDIELDRKEEFVADARRQFEEEIKTYCAAQEQLAEKRGLIRVKRRRAGKIRPLVKMTWTVQRQCGGRGFEQIAQAHYDNTNEIIDVSTIIKAVKEQSDLIGLDDGKI